MTRSRTLVLVDGRNMLNDLAECFGRDVATNFDIARLARVAVSKAELPTEHDIKVYVGTAPTNGDGPWVSSARRWQAHIRRMKAEGIAVATSKMQKFRTNVCHSCTETLVCMRCASGEAFDFREKGVDVKIATEATLRLASGEYVGLVLFSQDRDYKPLMGHLRFTLNVDAYSAFPICGAQPDRGKHQHAGIEHASPLAITRQEYESANA